LAGALLAEYVATYCKVCPKQKLGKKMITQHSFMHGGKQENTKVYVTYRIHIRSDG